MSYDPNQSNTGGDSVDIEFDAAEFPGGDGNFNGQQRKIKRVEVIDNNTGRSQDVPLPANGKCTIKIYTQKNPT